MKLMTDTCCHAQADDELCLESHRYPVRTMGHSNFFSVLDAPYLTAICSPHLYDTSVQKINVSAETIGIVSRASRISSGTACDICPQFMNFLQSKGHQASDSKKMLSVNGKEETKQPKVAHLRQLCIVPSQPTLSKPVPARNRES